MLKSVVIVGALAWLVTSNSPASAGWITCDYNLNGTFTDSLGGPSLVVTDGTLGSTGYMFRGGLLPGVAAVISPTDYSVELLVCLTPDGLRKSGNGFKLQAEDARPVKSDGLP